MDEQKTVHVVDATGQSTGRLATNIATLLMGKHRADYAPNKDAGDCVTVEHAALMRFTGNKFTDKLYFRHSGHPGGLKSESVRDVFQKNPGEVLRRAVLRMLPKNRLQNERMKRLTIQ